MDAIQERQPRSWKAGSVLKRRHSSTSPCGSRQGGSPSPVRYSSLCSLVRGQNFVDLCHQFFRSTIFDDIAASAKLQRARFILFGWMNT